MIKDFDSLSWMDYNTTKSAEEKVDHLVYLTMVYPRLYILLYTHVIYLQIPLQAEAIVKNIGFPKFALNETLVKHFYTGVGLIISISTCVSKSVINFHVCVSLLLQDVFQFSLFPDQYHSATFGHSS